MGDGSHLHAELDSPRAELAPPQPPGSCEDTRGAEEPAHTEQALRELGDLVSALSTCAEDAIVAHPLTSMVAALLLGVAIGRLTARA